MVGEEEHRLTAIDCLHSLLETVQPASQTTNEENYAPVMGIPQPETITVYVLCGNRFNKLVIMLVICTAS